MLSCFSSGWSICRVEIPSSDIAAWLQAIGSIVGIAIAIFVPYTIHRREQRAADAPMRAYKSILRDALSDLAMPLAAISAIGPSAETPDRSEPPVQRQGRRYSAEERRQAAETAQDIAHLLSMMTEAANIIDEVEGIGKINTYELIKANFKLKRKISQYKDLLTRESALLVGTPTPPVVQISIAKLREPIEEIYHAVQMSLVALEEKPPG